MWLLYWWKKFRAVGGRRKKSTTLKMRKLEECQLLVETKWIPSRKHWDTNWAVMPEPPYFVVVVKNLMFSDQRVLVHLGGWLQGTVRKSGIFTSIITLDSKEECHFYVILGSAHFFTSPLLPKLKAITLPFWLPHHFFPHVYFLMVHYNGGLPVDTFIHEYNFLFSTPSISPFLSSLPLMPSLYSVVLPSINLLIFNWYITDTHESEFHCDIFALVHGIFWSI